MLTKKWLLDVFALVLSAVSVRHPPGGRGLSLHLLTVPDFDGAVVGRRGEDRVFV